MTWRVFISYSSVDDVLARDIASVLDSLGVHYFLDQKDISWGQPFSKEIEDALGECLEVIVIISPASLKSQWVPFEVGIAKAKGKRVLPFLAHPSVDIPSFLSEFHYYASQDYEPKGKPQVVLTNPYDGETGVSRDLKWITIKFDREMIGGFSVSSGGPTWDLSDATQSDWSDDLKTFSISRDNAEETLPPNKKIVIILNGSGVGFQDTAGNNLEKYIFRFTTATSY
jgi:hypothetical protein